MKALPGILVVLALAVGLTIFLSRRDTEEPPRTAEAGGARESSPAAGSPTNLDVPGSVARSEAPVPAGPKLTAPDPLPEPWMEDLRGLDRQDLSQQFLKYKAALEAEMNRLADEKIAAGEAQWVKGALGEDPLVVAERLTPPGKVGVARPGPVNKDSGTADFQWVVLDPAEHDELRENRSRLAWIEQLLAPAPR